MKGLRVEGFRVLGFKGLGFKGLGFKGQGFRSLGVRGLGGWRTGKRSVFGSSGLGLVLGTLLHNFLSKNHRRSIDIFQIKVIPNVDR